MSDKAEEVHTSASIPASPILHGSNPSDSLDVVTLVHGTFARGAAWTTPGSHFRESLQRALPNAKIQTFLWSGQNSHFERIKAGQELAQFLGKQIELDASNRHVVISHSHGGNVVLHAMRDPRVLRSVRKVVFLGTPFITCSKRDFRPSLVLLAALVNWLLVFPVVMPFGVISLISLLSGALQRLAVPFSDHYFALGGLGVVLGIGACSGFLIWHLYLGGTKKIRKLIVERFGSWLAWKQDALAAEFALPRLRSDFLVVYDDLDEALVWLRIIESVALLPNLIWDLCLWGIPKFGCLVLGLFILSILVKFRDPSDYAFGLLSTPILAYVFLCIAAILIYISCIIVPPIMRGTPIGFGKEALLTNVLLRVSPARLPNGSFSGLGQLLKSTSPKTTLNGLRHSLLYSDLTIVDRVTRWIQGDQSDLQILSGEVRRTGTIGIILKWSTLAAAIIASALNIAWKYDKYNSPFVISPLYERSKWAVLTEHRQLANVDHRVIANNSHTDIPFNVNSDLRSRHCHISGHAMTSDRGVYFNVYLWDWLKITKDEIESNPFIEEREKEYVKPIDEAKQFNVFDNRDERKYYFDLSFDKHLDGIFLDYTKTGGIYIGNYDGEEDAVVSMTIFLDCYAGVSLD